MFFNYFKSFVPRDILIFDLNFSNKTQKLWIKHQLFEKENRKMSQLPFRIQQIINTDLIKKIKRIRNSKNNLLLTLLFFSFYFLYFALILCFVCLKCNLCVCLVIFDIFEHLFNIKHCCLIHVDILFKNFILVFLKLVSIFICFFSSCAHERLFSFDNFKQINFLP